MNESDRDYIQRLLKSSLPRVTNPEPSRDLWPEMLERIEAGADSRLRFALLDWVLVGLVAASMLFFPSLIPGLLYHL
jgi:hypothetical protein